jgi:hypothetical protein
MDENGGDYRIQKIFNHNPAILTLIYSRYSDAATLLVMLGGHAIILSRVEMSELIDWLVEQREKNSNRTS